MNLNRLRLQAIISSQARKRDLPYLCELEYLESTGEQWITIPYKIVTADTFRHETAQYYTNTSGNQYEGQSSSGNWFGISSGGKYTIGGGVTSSFTASTSSFDNIVAESDKTGLTLIVNGNVIGTRETKSSGNRVRIFDCESTTTTSYKCYIRKKYHKLYVNGEIFFDGIPVLDYDMKPAMYDRVTKTFFYNEGTGEDFKFALKRGDKRAYTEVEYLESTGQQYINTGYRLKETDTVKHVVKQMYTKTDVSQYENHINSLRYFGINESGFYTTGVASQIKASTTSYDDIMFLGTPTTAELFVNGELACSRTGQVVNSLNIFIFGADNGSKGQAYCYVKKKLHQIYVNDVLIFDGIPVLDYLLRPAMFDRVSGKFFYNEGTGADFKYGLKDNEGNLYTSVSYLESTGSQQITFDFSVTATDSFRHETEQMYTKTTGDQLEGNAIGGGWFGCRSGIYKPSTFDVVPSTSSFDKIIYNCVNNRSSLTVNDVQLSDSFAKVETTGFRIFNAYSSYSASYNCYVRKKYHRFYINNKLKFAGVPVINANGKPAMFDIVTKKPFYNDGTGADFIVGE